MSTTKNTIEPWLMPYDPFLHPMTKWCHLRQIKDASFACLLPLLCLYRFNANKTNWMQWDLVNSSNLAFQTGYSLYSYLNSLNIEAHTIFFHLPFISNSLTLFKKTSYCYFSIHSMSLLLCIKITLRQIMSKNNVKNTSCRWWKDLN